MNEINIAGVLVDGTLNHVTPFPSVKTVFIGGNFEKNLLTNLFPKLQNLVLDYSKSCNFLGIDSHFPHLENMSLIYPYAVPDDDKVSARIFIPEFESTAAKFGVTYNC